jgi:hypothetical protein
LLISETPNNFPVFVTSEEISEMKRLEDLAALHEIWQNCACEHLGNEWFKRHLVSKKLPLN